jgi:ankyrin repeat protein
MRAARAFRNVVSAIVSIALALVALSCMDAGTRLVHACFMGDLDTVRRIATSGSRDAVNAVVELNGFVTTPLSEAMIRDVHTNADMVRVLLENGADIKDAFTPHGLINGEAPIELCIDRGDAEIVRAFLENDANREFRELAAERKLLHRSIERIYDTGQNANYTQYHHDVFQMLLDSGINIETAGPYGGSALHSAAMFGLGDITRELLDRDAKVDQRDDFKRTPLMLACAGRPDDGTIATDVVELLLEHGAQVSNRDARASSPLAFVAECANTNDTGMRRTVELLKNAGVDMNVRDMRGLTALHIAAARLCPEICTALIENGADANALSSAGATPLAYLIDGKFGRIADDEERVAQVVSSLLTHGADPDSKTSYGATALHAAARLGLCDLATTLVSAGADVNAKDSTGETPLHKAAIIGNITIIRQLINAGAGVNARDDYGCTPLIEAAKMALPDVMQFLVDRGASPDIRDVEGMTAKDWLDMQGETALPGTPKDDA